MLLNSMFAGDATKPTAQEIWIRYNQFIAGLKTVINEATGEVYSPKEYKSLSAVTVSSYRKQWANRIGIDAARSGDRQKLMQQYKPHFSFTMPEYAGSLISIDDRNPPFKCLDGKRVWFYMALDVASDAFTCYVYGKEKEGIIKDFYRQLVRNYHGWGLNLPAGLEAESSLNSSFTDTFLREGAMFQHVSIYPNSARSKIIERRFRDMRYMYEKKNEGWLGRPFALSEANQQGPHEVPKLPFEDIVEMCIAEIERWNNMPHFSEKEAWNDINTLGYTERPYMSRWQYFINKQHPKLPATNYLTILPYLGEATETSVNVGRIKLNYGKYLLGENGSLAKGERLIQLMKQVEGKDVTVRWEHDNDGNVMKALVYTGSQYICEAIAEPKPQRAEWEKTSADHKAFGDMMAYVSTIEGYQQSQKNSFEELVLVDNMPEAREKDFVAVETRKQKPRYSLTAEALPELEAEAGAESERLIDAIETRYKTDLKDRF